MNLLKHYLLNFWLWWYFVQGKRVVRWFIERWLYMLELLNVLPMIQHFTEPLYQDYSFVGYAMSFPIRLVWIVVGSIIQIFITLPLLALVIVYFILPILPIVAVVKGIFML